MAISMQFFKDFRQSSTTKSERHVLKSWKRIRTRPQINVIKSTQFQELCFLMQNTDKKHQLVLPLRSSELDVLYDISCPQFIVYRPIFYSVINGLLPKWLKPFTSFGRSSMTALPVPVCVFCDNESDKWEITFGQVAGIEYTLAQKAQFM